MSRRKTKRGERFTSISAFIEWVASGYYVYYLDKPTHSSWALGWQLGTICRHIDKGDLYECLDSNDLLPYTSSSLAAVSKDLDLSDIDKELIREADLDRRKSASDFYRNVHADRYHSRSTMADG